MTTITHENVVDALAGTGAVTVTETEQNLSEPEDTLKFPPINKMTRVSDGKEPDVMETANAGITTAGATTVDKVVGTMQELVTTEKPAIKRDSAIKKVTGTKKESAPKKVTGTKMGPTLKKEAGSEDEVGGKNEEGAYTDENIPKTPKKGAKKRGSVSDPDTKDVATPKKVKSRTPVKAETPPNPRTPKSGGNAKGLDTEPKSSGRKRAAPVDGVAPARGIPTSWENATEADRKLVQMKEAGSSWTEIRDMWTAVTGQATGVSTLPNRYLRIKVNLEHLESGDDARLLAAQAKYESQKWQAVAAYMEAEGAKKYAAAFLQKEAKKIDDARAAGTYVASNTIAEAAADGEATAEEEANVDNGEAGDAMKD